MGVSRDSITVHIETLVLHGFPSGSRHAIADAVQEELVRLLTVQGVADTRALAGGADAIDGGSFRLSARADPRANATGIARGVHAALSQPKGEGNGRY